ncbi:hypothetical protein K450DRAFT_233828 [Umbelopsis ramanniana AG]|uniref:Uncharacterized protein n=1 Tax=Umbelopsis ramanniana AG TaxID=1314678 RepID=A0AAD5ECM5_UMBRA|nr:uncharacterized protein K450DRAFT_233828 [Umbelopsis ramanniana AG]KAI8581243.1 hypothetical protein K450DRAFT_233828 [Umbelopsis ramanniana AG]
MKILSTALWPLFHYLTWSKASDGREEKVNWEDYVAVNTQFAQCIASQYRQGDKIWIQDYHLLLVPELLRALVPEAPIGLFFHVPFPSSELFRCLSTRKQILTGLLGADLIGFQTFSYARHFISSCTRVLGHESTPLGVNAAGHIASVCTIPIGINAQHVDVLRNSPGVIAKVESIRETYKGKKIIVGRDKLDVTKGVIQKLSAFEKFLEMYPQWRDKVVLIQVTTPTHSNNSGLESKISDQVSHINNTYGSFEFLPIHYYHQDVDPDQYYALLSVADLALITSVRDGMNTTSLEYIMCQQERKSPLILSEFTGMAGSLSAAMMVNPWNFAGVAKAIDTALSMPLEDKITRHTQLFDHVKNNTSEFWAQTFVKQLQVIREQPFQFSRTPLLDYQKLKADYDKANKRIMFFDYDGTLTPIVSVPSAALPPKDMSEYLQILCDDPKNEIWVISGRDQEFLEKWLGGIRNLGFSAEHGCFMKQPNSDNWINMLEDVDMSWKNDVLKIFDYYTERTQGSFVEHKKSSITWHYRLADPQYGLFQAQECQNHLENALLSKLPVEVMVGKKNLEVRPLAINKGEIVKRLLALSPEVDFIACAGDDKTDEDMFRALCASPVGDSCYAITVGPSDKKTLANWHVENSEDIVQALGLMAGAANGQ